MRPSFAPFAGAALCLALVAGCSGDEQRPSSLPPVSPSPVESVVPSPTPSLTEEQAVEAAVRFYFEGFNRAFAQRDARELAKASLPACNCREAVAVVEEALGLGEIQGNKLTIEEVVVTQIDGNTATADARYSTEPGKVIGPDGALVAELTPETRARRGLFLTKNSGTWLVARVEVLRG